MQINVRNKNTYSGEGEYIGRPSPLGNPSRITPTVSRSTAIYRYTTWLYDQITKQNTSVINELNRLFQILVDRQELNLICYCAPKECHGEIIKQILMNRYYTGDWLIKE